MDKFAIQRLRDLPIEGVAERLGLHVARHKSLCPFHADTNPSLSFCVRKNTCRCFVCMNDSSLGTIDLVMRCLHKDFRDACKWLADTSNIIIDEHQPARVAEVASRPFDASRYERFFMRPWLSPEACRFLYAERLIDQRVVRWCRLTSWRDSSGTGWLQIPYYDEEWKLIGVQNRNLSPGQSPRFRFPSGSHCSIYNLPVLNLLGRGEELYITEGASDCWAMLSAGHKAIAIPSATLLSQSAIRRLCDLATRLSTTFHMYPDRDAPGERLFMQLQQVLPGIEHHQLPSGCKDYSDYYRRMRRPCEEPPADQE